MRAVGWNLAQRAQELGLTQGSVIDVAYRVRENDHPEYGGLQIELAGIRAAQEK
jgi:single-stranded-DNA-specific exonuclease